MKLMVTIDRDEDGAWIVECPSIPGCVSQGATREEMLDNIRDAIKLCLEVRAERGMPLTVVVDDIGREVDLVRQNQELREFLDRRSSPGKMFTIEQARKLEHHRVQARPGRTGDVSRRVPALGVMTRRLTSPVRQTPGRVVFGEECLVLDQLLTEDRRSTAD